MKIVINKCFGGFELSAQAVKRLAELQGRVGHKYYKYSDRTNPLLVQVVEELGAEMASGLYAKLVVVEIPDGIEWEIDEYDGIETVHEKHRSWG